MRWLVILVTAATLAVNALANTARLNGVTTGEVASRYDNAFTPAGYVFGIWGFIYVSLVVFSAWQSAGAGASSRRAAGVRAAYVFSGVANVTWLVFWHQERLAATLGVMLLLAASLVAIYRELAATRAASRIEWWCLDAPFSVYLGWITAATLANVAACIAGLDLLPATWPPTVPALVLIATALAIGAWVSRRRQDALYVAMLAWALVGIALKPGQGTAVATTAGAAAALLVVSALATLWRQRGARPVAAHGVENPGPHGP